MQVKAILKVDNKIPFVKFKKGLSCQLGLLNTPTAILQNRNLLPNECSEYGTKSYLMVRNQSMCFGECDIPLNNYYFLFNFDTDWLDLLELYEWVKQKCSIIY